jgi:hypothetical protein
MKITNIIRCVVWTVLSNMSNIVYDVVVVEAGMKRIERVKPGRRYLPNDPIEVVVNKVG